MRPFIRAVIFAVSFLVSGHAALAQPGDVQGVASLVTKSSTLKPTEQEELKRNAMLSALNRYSANFTTAKMNLFMMKKADIEADLASYFADVRIVEQSYEKASKTHSIVVRGILNQAKLDLVMNAAAPSSATGVPIAISFLFVAREASSVKEFQTRATRVEDIKASSTATTSLTAGQTEKVTEGGAALQEHTGAATALESTAVTTTGGSDLKQANKVTYSVTSPENINAAMLDVFTSGGFEVYDYKDVASNCSGSDPSKIYPEFANADELSADTRKAVFTAARACEVNAFAIGTLDVGIQDTDPTTGNKRVFVSVRSQVYSLAGKLPRPIASVGPIQFSGLGPDQAVAGRNALQQAAKEVASSIAAQLRARGL